MIHEIAQFHDKNKIFCKKWHMHLHMSIFFFVTLQPDFCVHMNACEGMRTLDAKRGCIESQKIAPRSGGKWAIETID